MAKSLAEIEATFRAKYKQEAIEIKASDNRKQARAKKAFIISDVIFYFALVAMVLCTALFSRGAMGEQALGSYRFFEILSTSMDSVYPKGSLVITREVHPSELRVGDDITFIKSTGMPITHRIVEIKENYEGTSERAFVTKGVNNATADEEVVIDGNVLGKVTTSLPGAGALLAWLGENLWSIILMFVCLMVSSFSIKIFWREGKHERKTKNSDSQQI